MWIWFVVFTAALISFYLWFEHSLRVEKNKFKDALYTKDLDVIKWKERFLQDQAYNYYKEIYSLGASFNPGNEIAEKEIILRTTEYEQIIFKQKFIITQAYLSSIEAVQLDAVIKAQIRDAKIKLVLDLPFGIVRYPTEDRKSWQYVVKLIALKHNST